MNILRRSFYHFYIPVKKIINRIIRTRKIMNHTKGLAEFMLDEESVKVYEARKRYNCTRDTRAFLEEVCKLGKNFEISELACYKEKRIVFFGEGDKYKEAILIIRNSDLEDHSVCLAASEESINKIVESDVIIPVFEDQKREGYWLSKVKERFCDIIIHHLQFGFVFGLCGNQYFDVFEAEEGEVFVDAGCCDGATETLFLNWASKGYRKIYAFEPDSENYQMCEKYFDEQKIEKVNLIQKGTYSENKILSFKRDEIGTGGGRIDAESGDVTIELTTIDETVEEPVTYIKMDIEGSELEALKGAQNTIKKYKPKLAICIYHKDEDIYEIPHYILSLVPEYRFYVRHYSSGAWETVLYAQAKGRV